MIRSMTGFGRASAEVAGRAFEIEVRSVNHRHLDIRVRLPRQMAAHEALVKSLVQGGLKRGKVDVSLAYAGTASEAGQLELDTVVVDQYVAAARELAERHGLAGALAVSDVLSMPGVTRFTETCLPEAELVGVVTAAVEGALRGVDEMRVAEGAALAADLESRLSHVEALADFFEQRAVLVLEAVLERLRRRTEQIRQEVGPLDESRLHQEIVIAADRLDITEELVRLRSHVEQFRGIMAGDAEGEPVGRRLDFLLQEMAREANTIGSKANDAPLAQNVVELKTQLERIREQVQNVE